MTDTILSLENIEKSFDGEKILKNISLDIGRGDGSLTVCLHK